MLHFESLQSMDFIDEWIPTLRIQDKIEIGAQNQRKDYINDVLTSALQKSHYNYVLYNDETVLSIFGVKIINRGIGMPWFLSAEIPGSVNYEFIKISKKFMEELKEKYEILYNFTLYNNDVSHEWLKFLGFKIMYDNVIEKHDGRKLVRFEWRKEWGNY